MGELVLEGRYPKEEAGSPLDMIAMTSEGRKVLASLRAPPNVSCNCPSGAEMKGTPASLARQPGSSEACLMSLGDGRGFSAGPNASYDASRKPLAG